MTITRAVAVTAASIKDLLSECCDDETMMGMMHDG